MYISLIFFDPFETSINVLLGSSLGFVLSLLFCNILSYLIQMNWLITLVTYCLIPLSVLLGGVICFSASLINPYIED